MKKLSDKEIEALGAQLVKEMHEEFQASLAADGEGDAPLHGDPVNGDEEKSNSRPKKKQRNKDR